MVSFACTHIGTRCAATRVSRRSSPLSLRTKRLIATKRVCSKWHRGNLARCPTSQIRFPIGFILSSSKFPRGSECRKKNDPPPATNCQHFFLAVSRATLCGFSLSSRRRCPIEHTAFEGSAITTLHLLIVRHYFEFGHSDFVIVLLHSRTPVPP